MTNAATIVLLPSVLLGSSSAAALTGALRDSGRSVVVAETEGATMPEEVAARYGDAAPEGPVTWVAHSNAGLYLPRILRDRPGDVGIFVDASLPGEPPHVSASGARLQRLRELADDRGWLPAWVDWWTPDQLAELLPERGQRRMLRFHPPRLPLSYFTAEIDVPDMWDGIAAGYLSFDGGYVAERERAAASGWATAHVSAGHLGLVTRPREVARAVADLELAQRLPRR